MKTKKKEKTFSVGILLLSFSLVVASIYLFLRTKEKDNVTFENTPSQIKELDTEKEGAWKTLVDEEYGYSVKYPSLLEPRTIENDSYLSFVIFFVPQGVKGSGFALSVRESSLDEEARLIKEEFQRDLSAKIVSEERLDMGEYSGMRFEIEPITEGDGEKRTAIILNNGQYSYTISSTPDQIDLLFSNFKLI